MKILLDECVPAKLKSLLVGHQVFTVRMMGWDGFKNGDLIKIADQHFDSFVTIDKNLRYQQNLTRTRMSIVLISVPNNKVQTILARSPDLAKVLESLKQAQFIEI